jgi:hypothetical protein
MAPVGEDEVKRTIGSIADHQRAGLDKKGSELLLAHLPGRHHEIFVVYGAQATYVSFDPNIIGRISDDHCGLSIFHQHDVGIRHKRAAAIDFVITEYKEIPRTAYRRSIRYRLDKIGRIFFLIIIAT